MRLNFIKHKTSNLLLGVLFAMVLYSGNMMAQLSGTKTIPTDYATLAAAIADINTQGVNGALIINVPAGYTETAPVGGFVLTATGTLANTITFQKSGAGANPILTAYTGTATPGTASQDGVFRLIGSDYVTIDGIDINDPNAANPATMEFGYALYKASLTDGCQNNTIKNCVISLNRINNASGSAPMVDGSVGISVMNATSAAATTALVPTTAAGANSNNKFYTNTVKNCNIGIAIIGYAASTPFTAADVANDVGGSSAATGNTIINYGGGAATNPAAAIRTLAQYGINISFNTINNNNGSGVNHATTLRGIFLGAATSANASVLSNTITVKSGATTSALSAIENASGSTAASNTISISNNVITNCSYTTATTGTFNGILQSSSPAVTLLNNNTVTNSVIGASGTASSAVFNGIYSSIANGTNPVSISSNTITSNVINNQGGTLYNIRATTAAITVSNNVINNNGMLLTGGTLSSTIYGYYNFGSPTIENYLNNAIDNLIISGSSTSTGSSIYGTYSNTSASSNLIISGNNVHTLAFNNSSTGSAIVYGMYHVLGSFSLSKNKIYDLTSNGASSSVFGLTLSGTNITASNNLIGDLKTPSASSVNSIVGINVTGGTTVNVYYNTVYLSAASSGANFGSSAIFANATPSSIDIRNNIFINNSTPSGTGIAAAYRRSAAALTNYAATSNNNLFYAGTPSTTRAIFTDGTNTYSTLATYQTAMATRDQSSVTENVTFASTVGSNANFLHFTAGASTAAESGAASIATYSVDFDGDIRQGNAGYAGTGTSPDMGADEFNGTSPTPVINSVSITPTGSQCVAISRAVTATVTPGTASLTSVTLNYSFNGVAQTPIVMTGGNLSASSTWNATIPVSVPTTANVVWSVVATDGIYNKTTNGTGYSDEAASLFAATASVTPNPVCAGSTATLSFNFNLPSASSLTYCAIAAPTNSTTYFSDFITTGGVTNITNTGSGFSAGGYGSFLNLSASQKIGQSVTFTTTLVGGSAGTSIWIDWDKSGTFDASERVFNTTGYGYGQSGSFVIPANAYLGTTRMRIFTDFNNSNPASPCGPFNPTSNGEVEDYSFTVLPSSLIYTWDNGVTTFTTSTNTATTTVNTAATYTASTLINNCPLSATVQVNVTPLPTAPIVINSSQCGVGTSTASVSGGTSYNWYATPTSTTVLQSGTSTTYTTSLNATTTLYVSSLSGTCLSPRAAVTTTVTNPDVVNAVASATSICPTGTVTLNAVQVGNTNPYLFTWQAFPVAGSGMPTSVSGATTNVTPTLPGTYVYSVTATDGVCTTISSVNVTLNAPPTINASATPTVICSGGNVNLNATTPIIAAATRTIGAGSSTSSSGGSPFYHGWGGAKVQYIYTAAELTAQGIAPGNITAMALNVTVVGIPYNGFAINAGTTTQSAFAAANTINGLTQVFLGSGANNSYLPTLGVNTFNFSTPINWNGTDNLVISICWSNATTGGSSSTIKWDTYSTNVGMYIYSDSQTPSTVCSATTTIPASGGSATTTGRPQTSFTGLASTLGVGPLTWQWNPGAIGSNTAVVTPTNTGAPAIQVYTITGTNTITTCSNTATVGVLVNPLPATPVVANSTQCGYGLPTASVSGGTSYNWYATPTSTTVLQSGASATFTTAINATTSWYVSSYNGTCESVRALLTETVTIPDAVTASSTSTAVCAGSTFTLTATKIGSLNTYAYTWTASPAAGSGIPTSATGATTAVSPTTAGNYVYLVTAVDGVCTTTASVNVLLNALPPIVSTATPTMICSGSTVTLVANSVSSGTTAVGAGNNLTSSTGYPTAFGNYWYQTWQQYLFTAAELNALGLTAGNITSMKLNIAATPNPNTTITDYNVKIAASTNTALSTFVTTGLVNVFGPASVTAATGLNTITFSTPYNWDGVSNIVIDLRQTEFYGSGNATTYYTTTSNNSVLYAYSLSSNPTYWTSNPAPTTSTSRPNIIFSGQVLNSSPSALTWQWNPGAINSNTTIVTPTNPGTVPTTQVYTVTGTSTLTGCTNTSTASVVINPIPVTPTAFNSNQCGVAVPTASVTGGTSYNWYATPTSTTVLQSGTSQTYTNTISNITNFYVASFNGNCESPRALLTASVDIPDGITASSTSTAVCPGNTFTLTAASSGTTAYNYTWMASPSAGSGMVTSVTGATTAVTPTTVGAYTYMLTGVFGACTTTTSINVILNAPPILTAVVSPTMICSGSTVTLTGSSVSSGTSAIGTGSLTTSTQGITPYGSNYEGSRQQYLITAAELQAANIYAGNLTSLSFSVTALGAGTFSQTDFTIKLAHTANTSLNTAYGTPIGGFTTVYGPVVQPLPALGLNGYTFATPFNWDGVSNILVDICHDNDPTATCSFCYSGNSTVAYSTTSYNSVWGSYADNAQSCGVQASGTIFTYNNRPNMIFGAQVLNSTAGALTWQWNPGAINTNTTIVTPTNPGTVPTTVVYTVTGTSTVTGCSNTATTSVVVNPIPVTPTAFNSIQCGVAVPTASVTGGTSYNWYATPTSTTIIQAGTSQTYTGTISNATNFYVASFNGNCESPRALLTASVNVPDAVTATVSTSSICPSTSVVLSSTQTGSTNTYGFTWTASPATGSGISTSAPGASTTVTPTLPGTYVYTITAIDGACTAVSTTTVTVFTPPNASVTNTAICAGSSATLTASSIGISTGNVLSGVATLTDYTSGPYRQGAGTDNKAQWLFTAAELTAANIAAGNITAITFSVPAGSADVMNNFTIRMGATATTALTTNFDATPSTVVYAPSSVTAATGLNTYNFGTPFNWDGISNIIIQVCHDVVVGGGGSVSVRQQTIANRSAYTNISGACAATVGTSSGTRPVITFAAQTSTNVATSLNWVWNPGALTGNTVTVTPPNTGTTSITQVYTVTVTDPVTTCTNSATGTVTVNPLPTITAVASSTTLCSPGSLTLTATGATTYSWMPAGGTASTAVVSPTTNVTYTLTGTSLGCSSTKTVAITVNPTPTLVIAASPGVICAGATVSLTASGATNYTWSPVGANTASTTATPTISTTYSVTGVSAGCSSTKTVNVVVNNVPAITLAPTATVCPSSSAVLSAAGTATAYVWNTGATTSFIVVSPTVTTGYTVTGTNSCGTSTASTMVSLGANPTVTAVTSASIICSNNSAVLTASGTATSYTWNPGGANTVSITVSPTVTTTYTVTGENACGIVTSTVDQIVSPCTGIQTIALNSGDVSIYPNPASDYINIAISEYLASNNTTVEITDALGKLVMKESLNTDITTIRLTKLEDGVYFFKVISNNQTIKIGKVAKQ